MAEPSEPLRENESGKFEDLAMRPNPDSLVILAVPPIEDLIPAPTTAPWGVSCRRRRLRSIDERHLRSSLPE